jgi:hypothetical protein
MKAECLRAPPITAVTGASRNFYLAFGADRGKFACQREMVLQSM